MGPPSPLGQAFRDSRARLAIAIAFAATILTVDMMLVGRGTKRLDEFRTLAGLIGLVLYFVLARGDRHSLGLELVPRHGWAWWGKALLVLCAIVGGIVIVATGIALAAGADPSEYRLFDSPGDVWRWLRQACLKAPVLEEAIYRFVLCIPAIALIGPFGTILISGATFAALHFLYGNPSPDNAVAGLVLSWAYIRSNSLLLPVGLHALGNLFVGLSHVAACYI